MAEIQGDTTCSLHADRQATARCPSCRQFYCGECITEHDGRLTCASCLADEKEVVPRPRRSFRVVSLACSLVQILVALGVCWLIFYLFGQTLGDMPDDFHDGTIWE